MESDLEGLARDPVLFGLLGRYVRDGEADPDAWLDRPLEWNDFFGKNLAKLHGELLAGGWLEIHFDTDSVRKADAVVGCYRVTPAGFRAHRQAGEMGRP